MSRTDRHRPHWVQVNDPLEKNRYRGYDGSDWLLHNSCGCRWHGMYYWRHEENRRRRHGDQRAARDVLKGTPWE